uniref:Opsin 1 (cone pigments), short-wave-sensitive 1 n=1 Tax=Fundulus heteroclitus TaxID=8078 RepID=A0A3Q2QLX7_FUNHE
MENLELKMGKHFHLYENISKVDPFEGPQYHLAPSWAFYLQTLFMGFVFLAGTPLNILVLLATAKYKKLRAPLNYILVNISFAGFIFVTFSVFVCSARGYYFLGYTMCALEAAMADLLPAGLVTSWSLAMLSLERYLVICKPFGAFKFGSSHAAGAVVFTWFMGVGCASPPFFGWSRYIPEGLGCACGPDWYTNDQELGTTSYMYFLLITCFCMPLSIIIFSYSQLLGVAAQQAESASTQKAEKEVSRMIIVMVGSFVTCYAPYVNKDYRLVTIPAFFSKSSCVYNPLIYAFMNKQVRTNAPSCSTSEVSSKTEVSTAS